MAERGQVSNFSQKTRQLNFVSAIYNRILKCSEGMYVTYTSEIFSDPRGKKQVLVEQWLGLFGPGVLAIALGSKPSPPFG